MKPCKIRLFVRSIFLEMYTYKAKIFFFFFFAVKDTVRLPLCFFINRCRDKPLQCTSHWQIIGCHAAEWLHYVVKNILTFYTEQCWVLRQQQVVAGHHFHHGQWVNSGDFSPLRLGAHQTLKYTNKMTTSSPYTCTKCSLKDADLRSPGAYRLDLLAFLPSVGIFLFLFLFLTLCVS